jgi:rare lipoprotein A
MRTYLYSALAVLTFGLLTPVPAGAASYWSCMGPAVACGSEHVGSAYSYRSQGRVYAERAARRLAGTRARPHRSAKRAAPHRAPAQVASLAPSSRSTQPDQPVETSQSSYKITAAQSGMASYYGTESGSRTASGARYDASAMTAAHRSLPFGTKVRVTNKRNGRSVVVTINDRGPFVRGRIIDLSTGAAGVIGMKSAGVVPVSVEVLGG